MSHTRSAALWTTVAVALLGLVLFLTWRKGESGSASPGRVDPRPNSTDTSALLPPTVLDDGASVATTGPLRSDRSSAPVRLTIRSADGRGIAGAIVSWTTLGVVDGNLRSGWPWPAAELWQGRSSQGETDVHGECELTDPPGVADSPSVVWVTHADHTARAFPLGLRGSLADLPKPWILEPRSPISVTVLEGGGEVAPDATVFQRLFLAPRDRVGLSDLDLAAAYALQRRISTDALGRARLADLGGRQALSAQRESELSDTWIGSAPDDVRLQLRPTFTWRATIGAQDPALDRKDARVQVISLTGSTRKLVDAGFVDADGDVGPRSAALIPGDSYLFELEEIGVPTTIAKTAPKPGEHVALEFHPVPGFRYPVRVSERGGDVLSGAEVRWAWNAGDRWQWSTRMTGGDGVAVLEHAQSGASWVTVEKSGFIGFRAEIDVRNESFPPFNVELERGATLRGRVHANGKPVTGFTIVHRPGAETSTFRTVDIHDSKDGTFAIEGLPEGELSVFAVSPEWPRSPAQRVEVSRAVETSVDFELRSGVDGHGAIRDAQSSEPISGATIQVWTGENQVRVRAFGSRSQSDVAGLFTVLGLPIGQTNYLEVLAEGFAPVIISAHAMEARSLDLGIILLERPRALTVKLRVPEGDSATRWAVEVANAPGYVPMLFPASGELRFEGLQAVAYRVSVWAGADLALARYAAVPVESDGVITFDLTSGFSFDVEIVAGPSEAEMGDLVLAVLSTSEGYSPGLMQTVPVPPSRLARVRHVSGERVHLRVATPAGLQLGTHVPTVAELRSGRVRITLGSEERALRVIDRRGDPIANVIVSFGSPEFGWQAPQATGSDGIVRVPCSGEEHFEVSLERPPQGGGIVRDVRPGIEPTEITFDPRAGLAVRLLDGDFPLAGVPIDLRDGFGLLRELTPLVTKEDGSASNDGFLAQEFRGEVRFAGLWPARFTLRATEAAPVTTVQVRRRGSVAVHAKRAGLDLAGTRIEVESIEFGTQVDPWLEAGLVNSSSPACATDARGQLRLDGLPHGAYRWTIAAEDGARFGGLFEVKPHQRVDVEVFVP